MNLDNLYTYQREAVQWLCNNSRGLLEADVGAGKTLMMLSALVSRQVEGKNTVAIICSSNAINTWITELEKWYPEYLQKHKLLIFKSGLTKAKRETIWAEFDSMGKYIILCTYGTLRADEFYFLEIYFESVILDEIHRGGIRNIKSKTFQILKKIKADNLHWTTATLVEKSPADYFGTCNLAAPEKFKSYWQFANKYCYIEENMFGKEIGGLKCPKKFREDTQQIIYKIPHEVVDKQKPAITRQKLFLDMPDKLKKIYTALYEELMYVSDDLETFLALTTEIAALQKIRQLLDYPPNIDPLINVETKLSVILDKLDDIGDRHCIIFTPFRNSAEAMYKILIDDLGIDCQILYGGIGTDALKERIEKAKKYKQIIIATIQFAESYQCETVKNIFFTSFSYSVNENIQAEGRAHRVITKHPINVYYILYKNSIEERVYEIIDKKFLLRKEINEALK